MKPLLSKALLTLAAVVLASCGGAAAPERRYQHVAEVPVDLKAIDLKATGLSRISTTTVTPAAGQEQTLVQRVLSWRLAGITGIVIALVAGFIGWMLNTTQPTNDASQYLHISLPEDVPLVPTGFALTNRQPSLALSPDGSLLVYVSEHTGTTQLYKRSMDRFESPQPIPGTEQAYNPRILPLAH